MVIVLDSGPLGLLSNPKLTSASTQVRQWAKTRLRAGDQLVIPEIADYEVRRELLRARKGRSVARLDQLGTILTYLALTTAMMREAASLWAEARQTGQPTAHHAAIDGDVILAAQAKVAQDMISGDTVVVATTNPAHLARYTEARHWPDI